MNHKQTNKNMTWTIKCRLGYCKISGIPMNDFMISTKSNSQCTLQENNPKGEPGGPEETITKDYQDDIRNEEPGDIWRHHWVTFSFHSSHGDPANLPQTKEVSILPGSFAKVGCFNERVFLPI